MSEKEKATTHPLSFEELSDQAQQRALRDWEPFTEWDWWDDTVEQWYDRMREEYGIEGDDMQWDDYFSPWFEGKVVDVEKFINKVVPGLIEKSKSKYMQIEHGLDPNFWHDLYITFGHFRGRNPSSSAMVINFDDAEDVSSEILDQIEINGGKMIVDELKQLGGELSREWDYLVSAEAAIEEFESNDTKFNPDGSVYEQ